jgi:antitoxin ParD1/3/4
MEIILTPELEEIVNEKIKSGNYNSASEVVRDALERLNNGDKARDRRLEEIRGEVAVGLEQLARGEYHSYDSMDEFLEDVEAEVTKVLAEREGRSKAAV